MEKPSPTDPLYQVRIRASAKEPHLREANAVLAAITDVILQQKQSKSISSITATDYFAALMVALEQSSSTSTSTSTDSLGAIMYLLSILFPSMPQAVLKNKFEAISTLFLSLLENHAENTHLVKSLLTATSHLLLIQDGNAAANLRMVQALLVFSVDSRPKIRRQSQRSLVDLFRHSSIPIPKSLADTTVAFCKREIAACTPKDCQIGLYLCGVLQQIIHMLPSSASSTILESLLSLSSSGNAILLVQSMRTVQSFFRADTTLYEPKQRSRHMDLCDRLIDVLYTMKPHAADVNATIAYLKCVVAAFTSMSKSGEWQRVSSKLPIWMQLLATNLISQDATHVAKPQIVKATSQALISLVRNCITPPMVTHALAHRTASSPPPLMQLLTTFESWLSYKFQPVWHLIFPIVKTMFAMIPSSADGSSFQLCIPLLQALDAMHSQNLGMQYESILDDAIGTAMLYHGPERILTLLPLNLPTQTVEGTPLTVLLQQSRTWLIPMMKSRVRSSKLSIFIKGCLPLADQLMSLQAAALSNNRPVEAKTLETLVTQLWETFPSFCWLPTDIATSYKPWAKMMATTYLREEHYAFTRPILCRGIHQLIVKLQLVIAGNDEAWKQDHVVPESGIEDVEEETAQEEKEEDEDAASASRFAISQQRRQSISQVPRRGSVAPDVKPKKQATASLPSLPVTMTPTTATAALEVIASVAPQMLKVLFNLATEMPQEKRDTVLQAITSYASIASASDLNKLFQTVLKTFLETSSASASASTPEERTTQMETQHSLIDIIAAMSTSLNDDNITYLYRTIVPQLSDKDAIVQKKSYKILTNIIENHPTFFTNRWSEIVPTVHKAYDELKPSATKTRILCLKQIMLRMPDLLQHAEILSALPNFLVECMLAVKDPSMKTRGAAYDLLISVGDRMMTVGATIDQSKLQLSEHTLHSENPLMAEYVVMLAGGLTGGSPHMQSACVLALARLLYEFKTRLQQETIAAILTAIIPLMHNKNREVIKSVLGFIKVSVLSLDPDILRPHLSSIISGIAIYSDDHKNRFRSKIRVLFEILMRKYGVDQIKEMVPTQHHKLIDHIRKTKEREKRQKAEAWKAKHGKEDEDDDTAGLKKKTQDYESVLYGSDDDDDDEEEKPNTKQAPAKGQHAKNKNVPEEAKLWIRDSDVDFLDANVVQHVVSTNPRQKQKKREVKLGDGVSVNDAGKIVIADDGASDQKMVDIAELEELTEKEIKNKNKRKRESRDEDADSDDDTRTSRERGGAKRHLNNDGRAFAAKKAGGDVKRGKIEPFAFIPLDPTTLNKRNKSSSTKRFESVVRAAKAGSAVGAKLGAKARSRKKTVNFNKKK